MASPNISFTSIPSSIRKPGVYIEENTKNAIQGLLATGNTVCMLAQRLSTGTVAAKTPTKVFSEADAALYFGSGSVAHLASKYAFTANPYIDLTICGMDDVGSAYAAGSIAIANAATASGSIDIWIGDMLVSTSVASGDSAVAIAGNIKTNIDAIANQLPLATSTLSTSTIPLTARNAGTLGNYIAMSYKITGVTATTVTLTQMTSGAVDPSYGAYGTPGTILASVVGASYNVYISTLVDATNLGSLKNMIAFVSGPIEQRPAVWVTGVTDEVDTYANLKTLAGTTLNDGRGSIAYLDYTNDNLAKSECYKIAASYGALIATGDDPALPYNGLVLPYIAPPAVTDRFTRTEQEDLLKSGITPLEVIPGDQVAIVRAITTYTLNASSIPDPTLLDITTIRTLDYVRAQIRARLVLRFPRAKLSSRTPKLVRSQVLDVLYQIEGLEIIENVKANEDGVIVERDTSDANRLDIKVPADVVNGLHVIAGVIDLIL